MVDFNELTQEKEQLAPSSSDETPPFAMAAPWMSKEQMTLPGWQSGC
jgi:hypothetical protein